ncbi:hypothetical protein BDC45DRAFT_495996 [Circinella umbellata]|nr:hypothetical protein BDC45DRAFT_495996 [Circinella umbellata]
MIPMTSFRCYYFLFFLRFDLQFSSSCLSFVLGIVRYVFDTFPLLLFILPFLLSALFIFSLFWILLLS